MECCGSLPCYWISVCLSKSEMAVFGLYVNYGFGTKLCSDSLRGNIIFVVLRYRC